MISVVIPVLNEKKNISKISETFKKIKVISEVIFVDDNSSDGSFEEIKKLLKKKNKRKINFKGILRKSKKKDLSKSILLGVQCASQKNILVMDCDLQHDASYINSMWRNYVKGNFDVVVATRFLSNRYIGNLGLVRSFISNLMVILINIFFKKKTTDPLSGFFLCKIELFTKYKKNFFATGYKILFDILYKSKKNLRVFDQKISFKKRRYEDSKFKLKIVLIFIRQLIFTKFNI